MSTAMSRSNPPSREEILGYFSDLSNWGRWGDEDQLGTLNLITSELRRRAAALITEGVPCRCCTSAASR